MSDETIDSNDLTEQELCELSCFMPNLACIIEREPSKAIEATRRAARQELSWLLRTMKAQHRLVVAAVNWGSDRVIDEACYDRLEGAVQDYLARINNETVARR